MCCALAGLALDVHIHYLRFPEAVKPLGCSTTKQWPLPHLFPMEQSYACTERLCLCLCFYRPSPLHPTELHSGASTDASLLRDWVLNHSKNNIEGHCGEEREAEAPDVLII